MRAACGFGCSTDLLSGINEGFPILFITSYFPAQTDMFLVVDVNQNTSVSSEKLYEAFIMLEMQLRHNLLPCSRVFSHVCWGTVQQTGHPSYGGTSVELKGDGFRLLAQTPPHREKWQPIWKAWKKVPVSFAAALAYKRPISVPSQAIILWPNLEFITQSTRY